MLLTIIVGLLVLFIFVIATLVLMSSNKLRLNKIFSLVSYVLAIWITSNYIGSNYKDHYLSYYFTYADFFTGALALYCCWLLTSALLASTGAKYRIAIWQQKIDLILFFLALLAMASTWAPYVVRVKYAASTGTVVDYNAGFVLYAGILAILIVLGIINIFLAFRSASGRMKKQMSTIAVGIFVATVSAGITNLVLPQLTTSKTINLIGGNFAYLGVAVFVAATYYSIAFHKLFDIRFYVVRAAAYGLTLAIVSTLYIAPILYVADLLIPGPEMRPAVFIAVLLFMSLAAALYENIRKVFDRSTSRLFFRDAYDPESFIAELNQAVVSHLDLEPLLTKASDVICRNLKAEYCVVGLRDTAQAPRRVIGTEAKKYSQHDVDIVRKMAPYLPRRVVLTEAIVEEAPELYKVLHSNNISVLAILVRELNDQEQPLGNIILGPKKSGGAYTAQDVRILETVINGLIVAIQNALSFEEIQKFNVTLQQRVEDATRQLRRTNAKLEALDETKDDFISMASHQLRTPLTAVKGYLSMVLEGDAGAVGPLQKKMLNQAFMSSQRMVFLIADLLNVSRLKTGKFVIDRTPLNLANLIQEEIGQLRETASSQSLTLTYEKPKDFPMLMLDETKTRQVVMNFIDNAIHYTPAGGHIRVELDEKPHSVALRVYDDGIGVPRSEQHHLFTKFYRAANARRERPDGTGLGLFMAKKVVVAEGGAVVFESKENKGSTFGFTLPKDKLLVQAAQ